MRRGHDHVPYAAVLRAVALSAGFPGAVVAGVPFLVDDPGTVDPGHATLFAYYGYDRVDGVVAQTVPSAILTCGFDHSLELAAEQGLAVRDGTGVSSPRPGDLTLTPKWRFIDQDGAAPAVAVVCSTSFPTGMDPVGGDRFVVSPYLTAGWAIGGKWQIFGQLGADVPTSGSRPDCRYGVAAGYRISDALMIGVEVFGATRASVAARAATAVGLVCETDLSDSWSIMAHVDAGVAGPESFSAFVGPQLNF